MSRTATGIWRLADPKITMASAAAPCFSAEALAARDGPLTWAWLDREPWPGSSIIEVAKNVVRRGL
jgi:hypothetical protein